MTNATKGAVMDRANVHKKLDQWLDELARVLPNIEDGEEHVFKLTGFLAAYDDDDHPVISFTLETRQTEVAL
jgi:hypothetical protein